LIDEKIDAGEEREYFTITLYEMDIDRVRYSLAKYFRTRLAKIEDQLEFILSSPEHINRLSPAERIFAQKLNNTNKTYIADTIISRLPEANAEYFRINTDRYDHSKPNLDV
jgi:hypothetical protein